VTSLSLGQNRSVHVLKVNNGKTLLVGATPSQVNLIADLGDVSDDEVPTDAASFFDILSAKLPRA
jgi:flagellar biogenesis protein FliO